MCLCLVGVLSVPMFGILLVYFILIYFNSIVKQAFFAYVNHARIRSWNQPVLSN